MQRNFLLLCMAIILAVAATACTSIGKAAGTVAGAGSNAIDAIKEAPGNTADGFKQGYGNQTDKPKVQAEKSAETEEK